MGKWRDRGRRLWIREREPEGGEGGIGKEQVMGDKERPVMDEGSGEDGGMGYNGRGSVMKEEGKMRG